MSNEKIDFNKILKDSRETLLNPKEYFASMSLSGGFVEPLIKAAIYGTLAGLFSLLWSILGFSAMGIGAWGGALGIMSLIWSIIGAIIGVFIGGVVVLVISAICGGNTDFEASVRVSASLMVVYPISACLAFFYAINFTLGGVAGLVVNLYGLYLLYEAIIKALKGKESSMKIVLIVLAVIVMLGFFQGRRASNTFRDFTEMYED
ncbi:MAG: Yip1 family protein [Bacteroidota bacterium]|nr:Yip1 family protein [Bacteroidota bacterium]